MIGQEPQGPRVTVIVPCYNAAKHVKETVASVIAQTAVDWTLVLVDDGSTDDTPAALEALATTDSRIQVIRQVNQGVCAARNTGALLSKQSTFLYFLDADDLIYPDMLETIAEYMDNHPEVVLTYCGEEVSVQATRPG